jgi:hypothetical protein
VACYAKALFIRSEAEIRRPVVLLSDQRTNVYGVLEKVRWLWPTSGMHARMLQRALRLQHGRLSMQPAALCRVVQTSCHRVQFSRWKTTALLVACALRATPLLAPSAPHPQHFRETALPPPERFWRAVRTQWSPQLDTWRPRVNGIQLKVLVAVVVSAAPGLLSLPVSVVGCSAGWACWGIWRQQPVQSSQVGTERHGSHGRPSA